MIENDAEPLQGGGLALHAGNRARTVTDRSPDAARGRIRTAGGRGTQLRTRWGPSRTCVRSDRVVGPGGGDVDWSALRRHVCSDAAVIMSARADRADGTAGPRPPDGPLHRMRVPTAIASALVLVLTGVAWGLYRDVTAGITT